MLIVSEMKVCIKCLSNYFNMQTQICGHGKPMKNLKILVHIYFSFTGTTEKVKIGESTIQVSLPKTSDPR